jgi:phosphoglycolate phosphatase-like HAD superfamily hydrolase
MIPCYVFDIDGTLADNEHRQYHVTKTPKDWDAFFAAQWFDQPHADILDLCNKLGQTAEIIIATGRGEEHRKVTEEWLALWDVPYSKLLMRPEGDRADDSLIKINMVKQIIEAGYHIKMWFDDRSRVVEAVRAQGVRVLQVAPGNF